jgi:hypothetical protein
MIKIWLLNLYFYKCGDNDTSVATFVATLIKLLDTADLDVVSPEWPEKSWKNYQRTKKIPCYKVFFTNIWIEFAHVKVKFFEVTIVVLTKYWISQKVFFIDRTFAKAIKRWWTRSTNAVKAISIALKMTILDVCIWSKRLAPIMKSLMRANAKAFLPEWEQVDFWFRHH